MGEPKRPRDPMQLAALAELGGPDMMHLLWALPLVAGLAAVRWPQLEAIAMLVFLVCGLIGLAYLVMRPRGMRPPRAQQEPDTRDVERDLPPGPS